MFRAKPGDGITPCLSMKAAGTRGRVETKDATNPLDRYHSQESCGHQSIQCHAFPGRKVPTPPAGVTGGAHIPWLLIKDLSQGGITGVLRVSQTPLSSRQVFEVERNEELSHDEPCIWIAMERIHVALPREVMPNVFIHTQPNMTEQTLLKVLTDTCLWGKSEQNDGVSSSEG